MNRLLLAAACCALASPALADRPFALMKGKMKEGQWEYAMRISMPGTSGGSVTMPGFRQCVTADQIEKGGVGQKGGKMAEGCSIRNTRVSENSANYIVECTKDPKTVSDVSMTFTGDSFNMKQNTVMDRDGQKVTMVNDLAGMYVGPCEANPGHRPPGKGK